MTWTRRTYGTRLATAALVGGLWTLVGLLTTQLSYVALHRTGVAASWTHLFTLNLLSVWLWAFFTPAIVWLAWRTPFSRRRWLAPSAIHTVACLGFAGADVVIERAAMVLIELPANVDPLTLFFRRLFLNALCYIAVVAIAQVMAFARLSREREVTAARLASQLTAARMQLLQTQLRPHFLFNTLSMIAERVHVDPDGADRMIGRLSHLLRVSLATEDAPEVSFADEIESLKAYLDIMSVRLADRTRVTIDVDAGCLDAAVPTLLLQPLAENAYRHGLEPLVRMGRLTVRAWRTSGTLEIEIADDGRGFDPGRVREGLGLRAVRERLAEQYGASAELGLRSRPGGGTVATIRMPFRRLQARDHGKGGRLSIREVA